jgi:MazG family protein
VTDPAPRDRTPGEAFEALVAVIARLRAPDGCPWDRAQTLQTLKTYAIEEAYEVVEAIDHGDPHTHCEELGDLLLQVVLQARVAEEQGSFDVAAVCDAETEKLIRRHPHVLGDDRGAEDADEVQDRWEGYKRREGKGVLSGVPRTLPALLMALRMSEKVRSVGFDWPDLNGALDKMDEEVGELKAAIRAGDKAAVESEVGDVLFTVANLARIHKIDPEEALRGMLARFRRRFEYIERTLASRGEAVAGQPLKTLDALWEEAKRGENP